MTTARASAWTISRSARHEKGASSRGSVRRVSGVSKRVQVSHGSDGYAPDHLGRRFAREREDEAIEPRLGEPGDARSQLGDARVVVERHGGPVRPHERPVTFYGGAHLVQLRV